MPDVYNVLGGAPAAGGGSPGGQPINVSPPTTSGTPKIGQVQTLKKGFWSNAPYSFTYQWIWFDTGQAIAGAMANSYTAVDADSAHPLACVVTAINPEGSTSITTAPTLPIMHDMTYAYYQAMTVKPTSDRIAIIETFVAGNLDILARCDKFYITGAHDEQAAYLNLINPSINPLTKIGAPIFTVDAGVRGITGAEFYDTGWLPDGTSHFTLNDAGMGVFVLDNTVDLARGAETEIGNANTFIRVLTNNVGTGSPTGLGFRVNRNSTQSSGAGIITTAVGFTFAQRTSSVASAVYKNGAVIGTTSGASVAIGTDTFKVGGATTGSGTMRSIGAALWCSSLTVDQITRLNDSLAVLLTAVGAYDPANADGPPYVPDGADPYAPGPSYVWSKDNRTQPLNLTGFTLNHDSTFSDASGLAKIGTDGQRLTWSSPGHSDFGSFHFVPPTAPVSPFSIQDGKLRIRAEQVGGVWQAGHMQTVDSTGAGFAQTGGYFEFRLKLPPPGTLGAWPSGWLKSSNEILQPSLTKPELDVLEYYPGVLTSATQMHTTLHLRPGSPYVDGQVRSHWFKGLISTWDTVINDNGWHTYGALVTPTLTIVYLDRQEVCRIPTPVELYVPLYPLISMAGYPGESSRAVPPIDLFVDYFRAWLLPA